MAILKIARMGHPVLDRVAAPVADPTAPEIRRLVADLAETLEDIGGQGLAAPQVHVSLRVVVLRVPGEAAGAEHLSCLINPEITPLGDDREDGWEACLSVPGLRGLVPRWRAVRYRALGLDGEAIEREAEGFHARVVQHECDHLDGVLYPQRMTDLKTLIFESEFRHVMEAAEREAEPEPA